MAYPIWARPQFRLPSTYAHSHMPIRNISPYSTQSVRLNIPSIPHLDTPSSPFPDNAISVDVGSWSRDVGLSIRTESSPSGSIFNPTTDYAADSVLETDSDRSPVLSPSNSEYQLDLDDPRLSSPFNSDNNHDVDLTPRASGRLNDTPRQSINTPLIDFHSPCSDATTVCCRSSVNVDDTPSIPNTERIITPLPDTTNHTEDIDLNEDSDLGISTTGLDPNSKSFVPSKSQITARRIIKYDRTSGEYTYIDEPIPEHLRHHYQATLPHPTQYTGTSHGQCRPGAARNPPLVPVNQPYGPTTSIPPGFQHNLPPGLPLNCRPLQHGPPTGLPLNIPPRFQHGPPPGLAVNIPPRFQPGPPPGLPINIPPRLQHGAPSGFSSNIPPRFRLKPPPGFLPRPDVEPQHHVTKPVGEQVACEPYLDFEHVVPKFIKDYSSGHLDIHPHHLDRFIPREGPVHPRDVDRFITEEKPLPPLPISIERPISPLPISDEEPRSPLPLQTPEPISPASPGPPSKTIYMIRAGKGRSSYVILSSCEL